MKLPEGSPATKVVDADGHVVEPLSAFEGVSEEHRPRIARDASGYEHVTVGAQEILAVPLGTLATPGGRFFDPATFRSLDQAHPGGSDPRARLCDMDAEGIDQAVLYPSVGLYFWALEDPAAAVSLASAYNDWLASYCAADERRLFAAAMVALQDPAAAVTEARRAVEELGCKAVFLRPNPVGGRTLSDRRYEELWSVLEEHEVVVGIHEGSSVTVPTLGADRSFNPLLLHAVSHAFEQMRCCAELIAFGVLERHPGLRLVFLEAGGGWVPYWLERLDEQAEAFGGFCPDLKMPPSAYFARQCSVSYEVDEQTLPVLAPLIGEDRVVWGSDYPHHDATFPGAVQALRATMAPLPSAVQARILGHNAAHLYRLPSRYLGARATVEAYFEAITLQDPDALAPLFSDDARLLTQGMEVRGRPAIVRFYRDGAFHFDDLLPHPGEVTGDAGRLEVPIDLRIGGSHSDVRDVFSFAQDRISRLEIIPVTSTPGLTRALDSARP